MADKIRFEALYPFPPEQVWVVLTDPLALGEWLMPTTFEPVLGRRFQFHTKPAPGFSGVVECEVLTLDPPRRLSFTWAGGGIDTVVTFDLHREAGNTRLVMEQTGFKGMRGLMISNILKGGWKRMIEQRLPAATGRVVGDRYHRDPTSPDAHCETHEEN